MRLRHRRQIETTPEQPDALYYAVLGVGPEAETEEIHTGFRQALAKAQQSGDAEQVLLIEKAGAVLLDAISRADYDAECVGRELVEETATAILERFNRRRR